MSQFVQCNVALCDLQHCSLRQNKYFNDKQTQKCIRMGITKFKIYMCRGKSSIVDLKSCFTSLLPHRCTTKFLTVFLMIDLPKI